MTSNVSKGNKTPTQPTSISEVKYARKKELLQYYGINYIKLKFSYTWQKKSRWVLKCLCECRETIHTEKLGLLATKMLFYVH